MQDQVHIYTWWRQWPEPKSSCVSRLYVLSCAFWVWLFLVHLRVQVHGLRVVEDSFPLITSVQCGWFWSGLVWGQLGCSGRTQSGPGLMTIMKMMMLVICLQQTSEGLRTLVQIWTWTRSPAPLVFSKSQHVPAWTHQTPTTAVTPTPTSSRDPQTVAATSNQRWVSSTPHPQSHKCHHVLFVTLINIFRLNRIQCGVVSLLMGTLLSGTVRILRDHPDIFVNGTKISFHYLNWTLTYMTCWTSEPVLTGILLVWTRCD